MRNARTTFAVTVALVAMGALTACGGNAASNNGGTGNSSGPSKVSSSGGVLNIGLDADPPTLDPMQSTALVDRQLMFNIYDTLLTLKSDGTVTGGLAKSYDVSSDGLTYTLHLQSGVKFQDGTDFNASAVKFNLQRDMAASSARRSSLTSIKSIATPDASTVVLTLSKPFSPLPYVLTGRAGMMVSPTAAQKEGSNYANQPVGTGPYTFVSRVKGSTLTLTANKDYWQGAPKIQKVVWHVFTDPNVEINNFKSGALQLVDNIPASQLSSVQSNANYVVSNTAGLGYQGFYLNTSTAPFNNRYLREAVDNAINRTDIVSVVFKGEASPGWGPFSPASPVYDKSLSTPPAPSSSKVKQLLQQGGKPSGFSFTYQTAPGSVALQMAQMVQGMLQQDGIQMKIQQLDFGTLIANNQKHSFQASALGWSGRVDPDQDSYTFWHTGGPNNGSNFSDKTVDQLLDKARTVSSMSQRKTLYDQFLQEMHKQDPYIFLYYPNNVYAYDKTLQGFKAYPDGVFRVDQYTLSN